MVSNLVHQHVAQVKPPEYNQIRPAEWVSVKKDTIPPTIETLENSLNLEPPWFIGRPICEPVFRIPVGAWPRPVAV
jgi:hypothetical protein